MKKTLNKYYRIENNRKYLFLPMDFNDLLDDYIFDDDTYSIDFGEKFNQPLDNVIFPKILKVIRFGFDFNQPLNNVKFPNSLLDLALGGKFNHEINNLQILNNLESIEFGHKYEHSLKDIKFTNLFMILINNNNVLNTFVIPPSLQTIRFGLGMSIPLSDIILPDTIKEIKYLEQTSTNFDLQKVKFPSSLIYLTLPSELIYIEDYEQMAIKFIHRLEWSNLNNLPDRLEVLSVKYITSPEYYWNTSIYNVQNLKLDLENLNITNLPFSLKKIFTLETNFKYFTKIPFGCELHEFT
jgi:hypothetical protein